MYHRFDENKYPSTNIQMKVFKEQIETIENLNINFLHPKNIEEEIRCVLGGVSIFPSVTFEFEMLIRKLEVC